jgi:hypothetical protein
MAQQSKYLVCITFNNYSLCINHRLPTLCEWEGSPNNIVYHWPYIIAIDSQFIEIRNVDNVCIIYLDFCLKTNVYFYLGRACSNYSRRKHPA